MCDVAAAVYMPLLEETGYMPKHKYSYGQELRGHADRIAQKYGFTDRGIFRATTSAVTWNEGQQVWSVDVTQEQGPKQGPEAEKVKTKITGDYVVSMSGILNYPKLPNLPGIESFGGHQFHTSRWDYKYTGGSQESPALGNLKDKVVALVGTGPTSIQALPELAKYAKHVYVVQRTPSSVDVRGQCETDPEEWKKLRSEPGWQKRHMDNFIEHMSNELGPEEYDVVNDGWTKMRSYSALIGGPNEVDPTNPQTIMEHIGKFHAVDFPRQEKLRARVDDIVKDRETADRLKAWYPGWCKRPCFHDEYLQSFNRTNVSLIDTEGKGLDSLTQTGIVALGKSYDVDTLIWGTGFSVAFEPESKAGGMTITGRDGQSLSKYLNENMSSLFGTVLVGFPNLFCTIFQQSGATANALHVSYVLADLSSYLVAEAERRNGGKKVLIEPTREFAEQWAMQVAMKAGALAAMNGCTPSYLNAEGAADKVAMLPPQEQFKIARQSPWGNGMVDYQRIVMDWKHNGEFKGVEVKVVG